MCQSIPAAGARQCAHSADPRSAVLTGRETDGHHTSSRKKSRTRLVASMTEEGYDGETTERLRDRRTQGLVDEGPGPWTVQGDTGGWGLGNAQVMAHREKTMKRGLSEGRFTVGPAVNSSAPVPSALRLHEICAEKRRKKH